ncbi:MAG: ATPase, T2SS/T4P/T4SS family [Candidatus Micrarchaeota archaeon]
MTSNWKIETESKAGYKIDLPAEFNKSEARLLKHLEALSVEKNASTREELLAVLKEICTAQNLLLEKQRGLELVDAAFHSLSGFSVLDYFLEDDELEEVSVCGKGKPVRVFKRGAGWLETNCVLLDDGHAVDLANKMARSLGRRLSFKTPRINAVLPDGSRLHASIPPLNVDGVELTIRKFKREPYSVASLVANKTISSEAAAFLWLALQLDSSLLIAGNTGSGKTTMLNALFSFIPLTERVVVTEETPEISLPHEHLVRVVSNEQSGVKMSDLVQDTLRMRPDRLVVGEVRTPDETRALFDCLMAGQARGTYATFHALNSRDALSRLLSLGCREDELNALDLILVQRRFTSFDSKNKKQFEERRVLELAEVSNGQVLPLFSINPKTKRLLSTKCLEKSFCFKRLCNSLNLTGTGLKRELRNRARFLESTASRNLSFAEFTSQANDYLFK